MCAPAGAISGSGTRGLRNLRVELNQVRLDRAEYGTACDGTADATATIATALTAAAGGELVLPGPHDGVPGCIPLIASPGAGNYAVTIPTKTRIRCEPGAGFKLQGLVCVGGSHDGAACPTAGASSYCPSGICAGAQFAPTGGTTYGLFTTASGTTDVEIIGCTIDANGVDGYYTCSPASSNAGEPCVQSCSGDATQRCTQTSDCTALGTGSCTLDTSCSGGACTSAAGAPVGAGNVTVANLANTVRARLERVTVLNQRRGALGLSVGRDGVVFAPNLGRTSTTYSTYQNDTLTTAVQLGPRAMLSHGFIFNPKGTGVTGVTGILPDSTLSGAAGYVTVTENYFGGDLTASTGVNVPGFSGVRNNRLLNHAVCIYDPSDSTVSGNSMQLCTTGYQVCGQGSTFSGNEVVFSTGVVFGSSTIATSCLASHTNIIANFFGAFGGTAMIIAQTHKRCAHAGGATADQFCATAGDCACTTNGHCGSGGTCSGGFCSGSNACIDRSFDTSTIANNVLYTGGVDLSGLAGTTGTSDRNIIVANSAHAGDAFKFDASSPAALVNTIVASNSCLPATSSCIKDWPVGVQGLGSNYGVKPGEQQPAATVTLTNADGGAMIAGEAVMMSTGTANAVLKATAARNVVGVVVSTEGNGSIVQVVRSGITRCALTNVAVTKGVRVRLSSTSGRGEAATDADAAYAVMVEDSVSAAGGTRHEGRCILQQSPATKGSLWCGGTSGTVGAGSTVFMSPSSGTSNTTETNVALPAPRTALLRNLTARATGAPSSNTYVYTVRVNGSDTGITCTMTTSTSPPVCSDTTHTASAVVLQDVSLKLVTGASSGTQRHSFCLEVD